MFCLLAIPMISRRILYRATVTKTANEVVVKDGILRQREVRLDRRTMVARLVHYTDSDQSDAIEIADGATKITFGHLLGPNKVQELLDYLVDGSP